MTEKAICNSNSEIDEQTSQRISDAVLIARIVKLIDPPKTDPLWVRIVNHSLFSTAFGLFLGFVLTWLIGARITNTFTTKQAELEYQRNINLKEIEQERSFSNELNRTRFAKVAEVYEKFYVYESVVEEAMHGVTVGSGGGVVIEAGSDPRSALAESKELHKELVEVLNKNRGWLGDNHYHKVKEYADFVYEHKFALQTKVDLEKYEQKRTEAMESLRELQERMRGPRIP